MKKSIRRLLCVFLFVLVFQLMLSASSVFAATVLKHVKKTVPVGEDTDIEFNLPSKQYLVILIGGTSRNYLNNEHIHVSLYDDYYRHIYTNDTVLNTGDNDDIEQSWVCTNYQQPKGLYRYNICNKGNHELTLDLKIIACPSYAKSISLSTRNISLSPNSEGYISYKVSPPGSFCLIDDIEWDDTSNYMCDICEIEGDLVQQRIKIKGYYPGKTDITITLFKGPTYSVKASVVIPKTPILSDKDLYVHVGDTEELYLFCNGGKKTWSSNKKSIATVSKKGVVKGKKPGTCYVTVKHKGKKYKCKVHVYRDEPDFYALLDEYYTRPNCFQVLFKNVGEETLTILSGKKVEQDDYKSLDRKIRLKKAVKIKPNQTKRVKFYVRGKTTWPEVESFTLFYKFKYDGKTYNGRVNAFDSDYKKGKKWLSTYLDDELYAAWR